MKCSVVCAKRQTIQFEDVSTVRKRSINTWMEEFKPIVMEKYEFEYRDIKQ